METTPIGATPYEEFLPSPHGSGGGARSLEPHYNSLSTANGNSVRSKKELAESVTKIKPRDVKLHSLWLDELEEAFRDGDLYDAYMLDTRPSLTLIAQRYNLEVVRTEQEIRAIHAIAVEKYDRDNDAMFGVVKMTLDLSGPFFEMDRNALKGMTLDDLGKPQMRDGKRLIKWILKFSNKQDHKGQAKIAEQLTAYHAAKKLEVNSDLGQIAIHNHEYMTLWLARKGNLAMLEEEPDAYAQSLIGTYPDKPNDAPVVALRRWFAERITNGDAITAGDPEKLSVALVAHGAMLGIPEQKSGREQILAIKGGKKCDCNKCFIFGCMSNKTKSDCLVYMDQNKVNRVVESMVKSKKMSNTAATLLWQCREYATKKQLSTLRGLKPTTITEWCKQNAPHLLSKQVNSIDKSDSETREKSVYEPEPAKAPASSEPGNTGRRTVC